MSAFLHNTSAEPIRLSRVTLPGSFSGSVKILRTEIAVIPGTHGHRPPHEKRLGVVPGGLYETYPPAFREREQRCHVQELRPVSGYVLGPDEEARVLVWLRAVAPGPFRIDGHLVAYGQRGQDLQQFLPIGVRGSVRVGASPHVLEDDPGEDACADVDGVKNLNED